MRDYQRDPRTTAPLIHETIVSRRDCVDEASERIMQAVEALPCTQGSLEDIRLALSEALANAVVHGNHEDPQKKVDICATCDGPGQFRLVVTDQGEGFDPTLVPDPTAAENRMANHGRGLFLIKQLMDRMDFRLGGRRIVMTKMRQDATGRPVIHDEKEL